MLNEKDLHILYMRETGRWPAQTPNTPLGLTSRVKTDNSIYPYTKWLQEKLLDFMKSYTCYNCSDLTTCKFAFDHYNTNGDCLAIK